MDDSMLSLGVVLALVFVGVIVLIVFFQFIPFGLWLTALFSGIRISFFTLFGMRFRRVDPRAIVIPMIKQAGFDPVWFGIFLVLVVEMAEVSPPVGFNLFVLQTMSGRDSNFVALAALPFFFLLVVAVALITVFPDIVMVLPRMAFPG